MRRVTPAPGTSASCALAARHLAPPTGGTRSIRAGPTKRNAGIEVSVEYVLNP